MKPQTVPITDYKNDFILRVDTDVATAFAQLLCKVVEINPESFASCKSLEIIIKFFCDGLTFVQQKEFTKEVVTLFLFVVESVPQRLSPNGQ